MGVPTNIAKVNRIRRSIDKADDPAVVVKLCDAIDGTEDMMRRAGIYNTKEIRPANETRFEARWKLGGLLKKVEKKTGPGRGKKISRPEKSFMSYLKDINLDKTRASEFKRINAMPHKELLNAFAEAEADDVLNTVNSVLLAARPYWHQEKRRATHKRIRDEAEEARAGQLLPELGPFPLIYTDPPWIFETHTPDKTHRMPDDHYPTLTDQEIIDFTIEGKTVTQLASKDCSLFMWCTSSNLVRALAVMAAWGFEYKTHAVWDKMVIGLGLIFRNQHEVLLYGSRGEPPKPVELVSSVFRYRKTEHSVKPPEVRKALEKMYPFYDANTRLEMFSRGSTADGWTHVGYEATSKNTKRVA